MTTRKLKPANEVTTLIVWRDPNAVTPPFQTRILVALGSWRDEGRGFKAHTEIRVVRIAEMDTEGDEDEGSLMFTELMTGASKWDDLQFMLLDDDRDEIDGFSDSIMWWADMPVLPERRA